MSVLVSNLAGKKLAEVAPVPRDVGELRLEVERLTGIPVALQKFVKDGDVLTSDAGELPQEGCELLCVRDETPMYTWDVEGNPDAEQLQAEGNVLRSPSMAHDFCNVLTKEPMRTGLHYYEFVLHKVGDEQWCGVTESKEVAGIRVDGRSLPAWTYYAGRAGQSGGSGSIHNGLGALHACSKAVVEFEKACDPGNVIGMLVDMDRRVVAFALDGRLQGACKVPGDEPLYVLTHMDTREDHVELRKPSLEEAPPANLEALSGALLDAEKGEAVHW
ncbi:UVR8 [Symbiodinium pilosum]|uniref:UVR8 protein n=1 Tax=Symbiodinium pilosum TaxID=2952 RepID=A0A812S4Q7_SYMPI|nr:UVR8 [Symbiodinium pilosum]